MKTVPSNMCKICRFRSSCTSATYHPALCFPFIHSVVSNDSVSRQWRPWSDCLDAQAGLSLCCLNMPKDMFLLGVAHILSPLKITFLAIKPNLIAINKRGYQENIFLFLHENICCGYTLEVPCTSNEYPQHMFSWWNEKNISKSQNFLVEKKKAPHQELVIALFFLFFFLNKKYFSYFFRKTNIYYGYSLLIWVHENIIIVCRCWSCIYSLPRCSNTVTNITTLVYIILCHDDHIGYGIWGKFICQTGIHSFRAIRRYKGSLRVSMEMPLIAFWYP